MSCDECLIFEEKVRELQGEAFLGINTCKAVLTELQLGRFVKYKKIKDIKTTVKQWIIGYAAKGQAFLVAVYNRQTQTDTCIGIINDMIVESQLLSGIDLHEANLECKLGKDDDEVM